MLKPQPTALADLPAGCWRGRVKVRFGHCDPAGIVFFARFFDLLQEAVEDWFTDAIGLPYADLLRERSLGLGYAHAEADFFAPSRHGDTLAMIPVVWDIGRSSLALRIHVYRDETPILASSLVIVATRLGGGGAAPLPDDLRAALLLHRDRCIRGPMPDRGRAST